MSGTLIKTHNCISPADLNAYMTGSLPAVKRKETESHISSCPYCTYMVAEAYAAVRGTRTSPRGGSNIMKTKIDIWLILTAIMFILSFFFPKYFIQFLVGTVLFGMKWITDNKNTKMLIMIYEAWKHGGEKELGRVMDKFDPKNRL